MKRTAKTIALLGAGHLNLAGFGDLTPQMGARLSTISTRTPEIYHALQRKGHYRVLPPGPSSAGVVRTIPVHHATFYKASDPGGAASREAVVKAAHADVIISAQASPHLLSMVSAPFLREVLAEREARGIDRPLAVCAGEGPCGARTASAQLRRLVWAQVQGDPALACHLKDWVRFPDLVLDRVCWGRRIGPDGVVEVIAEARYRGCVLGGGRSWHMGALLARVGRLAEVLVVKDLAAFLARKLCLFNMIHAVLGYLGMARGYRSVGEALLDPEVGGAARGALAAVAGAFRRARLLPPAHLEPYLEGVIERICSCGQTDLLSRVCRDPLRKLGKFERLIAPALLVLRQGGPEPQGLIQAAVAAFSGWSSGRALPAWTNPIDMVGRVCGLSAGNPLERALVRRIAAGLASAGAPGPA